MVSMKDVARSCGVSIATVSKALNGSNDVSKRKKAEIRKVANDMGYLPNVSAQALKTKRTYNLGILFMDEAHSGLTHDYFSGIIESFKVTAEERGYDLTFLNNNKKCRRYSYYEHCRYRGLEGIVVACIDFGDPEVRELTSGKVPLVTIDHVVDGKSAVVSDNVQGMRELAQYICGRGHRRIAYIHGLDSYTTRARLGSFYQVLREKNIEIPEGYVKQAAYRDTAAVGRVTGELLDLPEPPTCILCPDDFSALGCINRIHERGLRIPEDVSVAGYDGITFSQVLEPKLTTLRQDVLRIGRMAAETLIGHVECPEAARPERIVIPGKLLPGASVKDLCA